MTRNEWIMVKGANMADDTEFGIWGRIKGGLTNIAYLSCGDMSVVTLKGELDLMDVHVTTDALDSIENVDKFDACEVVVVTASESIFGITDCADIIHISGTEEVPALDSSECISLDDYDALDEYGLADIVGAAVEE